MNNQNNLAMQEDFLSYYSFHFLVKEAVKLELLSLLICDSLKATKGLNKIILTPVWIYLCHRCYHWASLWLS